mgnify:CR=1 FL=1
MLSERESHRLRTPCAFCGTDLGWIDERNGQACVFCQGCGKHQYNSPKHERGLAPTPLRQDGIAPSVIHKVKERANFRCEGCGCGPDERRMDIGHRISEAEWKEACLPPLLVRDIDNLAWLCSVCNSGQGKSSLAIPYTLLLKLWNVREWP